MSGSRAAGSQPAASRALLPPPPRATHPTPPPTPRPAPRAPGPQIGSAGAWLVVHVGLQLTALGAFAAGLAIGARANHMHFARGMHGRGSTCRRGPTICRAAARQGVIRPRPCPYLPYAVCAAISLRIPHCRQPMRPTFTPFPVSQIMYAPLAHAAAGFVDLDTASSAASDPVGAAHRYLGIVVAGLAGLQLLGGVLRPAPSAPLRATWAALHRALAVVCILAAWAALFLGIWMYHARLGASLLIWVGPVMMAILAVLGVHLALALLRRFTGGSGGAGLVADVKAAESAGDGHDGDYGSARKPPPSQPPTAPSAYMPWALTSRHQFDDVTTSKAPPTDSVPRDWAAPWSGAGVEGGSGGVAGPAAPAAKLPRRPIQHAPTTTARGWRAPWQRAAPYAGAAAAATAPMAMAGAPPSTAASIAPFSSFAGAPTQADKPSAPEPPKAALWPGLPAAVRRQEAAPAVAAAATAAPASASAAAAAYFDAYQRAAADADAAELLALVQVAAMERFWGADAVPVRWRVGGRG